MNCTAELSELWTLAVQGRFRIGDVDTRVLVLTERFVDGLRRIAL